MICRYTHSNQIKVQFSVETFPTFCGGKIITSVCIPREASFEEWCIVTNRDIKTQRIDHFEEYHENIRDALTELTSIIVGEKPLRTGRFEVYQEHLTTNALHGLRHTRQWEELPKRSLPFSAAFIFIADALNGERNNMFEITSASLANSSCAWKPLEIGGRVNPNSRRRVNVWMATPPIQLNVYENEYSNDMHIKEELQLAGINV